MSLVFVLSKWFLILYADTATETIRDENETIHSRFLDFLEFGETTESTNSNRYSD